MELSSPPLSDAMCLTLDFLAGICYNGYAKGERPRTAFPLCVRAAGVCPTLGGVCSTGSLLSHSGWGLFLPHLKWGLREGQDLVGCPSLVPWALRWRITLIRRYLSCVRL